MQGTPKKVNAKKLQEGQGVCKMLNISRELNISLPWSVSIDHSVWSECKHKTFLPITDQILHLDPTPHPLHHAP